MRGLAIGVLGALAFARAAGAEVVDAQPNGFQVSSRAEIAAPPARVWAALLEVGRWWEPDHSYSGDPARNMTLEARPGGCFCERTSGGGVWHMTVAHVDAPKQLTLSGGLGPLASQGATGGLVFKLEPQGTGTVLTLTYTVGGYAKGGLQTWAAPVDQVLSTQVRRLEQYVETGRPGSAAR